MHSSPFLVDSRPSNVVDVGTAITVGSSCSFHHVGSILMVGGVVTLTTYQANATILTSILMRFNKFDLVSKTYRVIVDCM